MAAEGIDVTVAWDQILCGVLEKYITHGLSLDIRENNNKPYKNHSFIDWSPADGHLRVLIAGADPQTQSQIARNVLIDQNCIHLVAPILVAKFPLVLTVEYAKTWDADYDDIVSRVGGRVIYLRMWSIQCSFSECMHTFGDNYPLVQSFIKVPCPKEDIPANQPSYSITHNFTTPSFSIVLTWLGSIRQKLMFTALMVL